MTTADTIFIVCCLIALLCGWWAGQRLDAAMRRGEELHRRRK